MRLTSFCIHERQFNQVVEFAKTTMRDNSKVIRMALESFFNVQDFTLTEKKRNLTCGMPDDLRKKLDVLVQSGQFDSMSKLLEAALTDFFAREAEPTPAPKPIVEPTPEPRITHYKDGHPVLMLEDLL